MYKIFLWISWWKNFENRSTFATVIIKHLRDWFYWRTLYNCKPIGKITAMDSRSTDLIATRAVSAIAELLAFISHLYSTFHSAWHFIIYITSLGYVAEDAGYLFAADSRVIHDLGSRLQNAICSVKWRNNDALRHWNLDSVCGINSRILSVSLASHVSTHLLIHLSAHLYCHHHYHHPSLFHSFTPGSKPTFSTNPSHLRFLLPTGLPSWQRDWTGPIMLIVLFLVSHFNFLFVPCAGL